MAVIYGVILMSCLEDRAALGADTATADIADAATVPAPLQPADRPVSRRSGARKVRWIFCGRRSPLSLSGSGGCMAQRTKRKEIRQLLCITALPAVSGVKLDAVLSAHEAGGKLTGAAVSMASGNLPILLGRNGTEAVACVCEAFAARALHRDGFSWIGVSTLALFVIFLIGIAWLYRGKLLTKTERNFLFVYVPLTELFLRHQPCESSNDFLRRKPSIWKQPDDCVDRTLQCNRLQLERCICCSGIFLERSPRLGGKFRPMQRWLQLYCCAQTGALSMTG